MTIAASHAWRRLAEGKRVQAARLEQHGHPWAATALRRQADDHEVRAAKLAQGPAD